MVSSIIAVPCALVVIFALIGQGTSLKCYSCSNLDDKKCGVSFDFSDKEAKDYVVECVGQTQACRKVETTDSHKAVKVVIRSCWNSSGVEDLNDEFLDCKKLASIGKSCYCNTNDNGKPCNGVPHLYAFLALVMSAVVAVFAFAA